LAEGWGKIRGERMGDSCVTEDGRGNKGVSVAKNIVRVHRLIWFPVLQGSRLVHGPPSHARSDGGGRDEGKTGSRAECATHTLSSLHPMPSSPLLAARNLSDPPHRAVSTEQKLYPLLWCFIYGYIVMVMLWDSGKSRLRYHFLVDTEGADRLRKEYIIRYCSS